MVDMACFTKPILSMVPPDPLSFDVPADFLAEVRRYKLRGSSGNLVTVRMKSGDQAAGAQWDVESVYGKTEKGRIWFADLKEGDRYLVRSIELR